MMRLRLAFLLVGIAGVAVAADTDRKPLPRPRLSDEMLRQSSGTLPPAHARNTRVASSAPGDYRDQYSAVGADHGMVGRLNGPSPLSRPFDLLDGGTFKRFDGSLLTVEPKLQYDAPDAGWDLLKISL